MERRNFESLERVHTHTHTHTHTGNLKNKKGITLVALVVTIIILLILAGISIAKLTENGLFEKAEKAKEEQENAEIEEEKTLGDYENNINSYLMGINRNNAINESKVFSDLSCNLEQIGGYIKVTINVSYISGKSEQDVYEYIVVVNDKAYLTTNELECKIDDIKPLTNYKVSIIGIDIDTGIIRSENSEIETSELTFIEKILEYPIITTTGINNVCYECQQGEQYNYYAFDASKGKTTATDALPFECYDGDENTFAAVTRIDNGYKLQVSDEFKEKNGKLRIKANLIAGSIYGVFVQLNSSKSNLGTSYYQYWNTLVTDGDYYITNKDIISQCVYLGFTKISSSYSGYNLYEIYPYIEE